MIVNNGDIVHSRGLLNKSKMRKKKMTSAVLMFNPIRYAKKLVEAGFTQKQAEVQAEAQAEAISEIVDEKLATKLELEKVKSELKVDIELIRKDIEFVRRDIKELENKLIIKLGALLGSIMLGGIALLQYLK
jgi:hypothetical protein